MRVVCTGMSGTGRLSYVREVAALARRHGHDVAVFDVKEIMFRIAADRGQLVEEETILDTAGSTLEALRAAALEQVLRLAETTPHFILATHALFRWRNALIPGFDVHYLNQVQPDLYVTISDTITAIKGRLDRQVRWRHYSYNDLLTWRDEETFVTEMMASFQRKRHYLIARDQPTDTLYRLMFRPEVPTVYRSYPITHIVDRPGLQAECDALGAQLDEQFVAFDPMAIKDSQAPQRAAPPGPPPTGGEGEARSDGGEGETLLSAAALTKRSAAAATFTPAESAVYGRPDGRPRLQAHQAERLCRRVLPDDGALGRGHLRDDLRRGEWQAGIRRVAATHRTQPLLQLLLHRAGLPLHRGPLRLLRAHWLGERRRSRLTRQERQ